MDSHSQVSYLCNTLLPEAKMPKSAIQRALSREIRLPLAKYSHTSAPLNFTGVLTWTHVNGSGDLACSFDQFAGNASSPPRLILRVTRNDGILVRITGYYVSIPSVAFSNAAIQEQIDLAHFARMINAQKESQFASTPKSLFAVVVKAPSLAVKFPQSETHVSDTWSMTESQYVKYLIK